jgi:valyl-tRNA synthetase
MLTYRLVWDDFCSWYLESIKPDYQKPIDRKTLDKTIGFMDDLLKLLHPFMPFLTEEIWHLLANRETDIIVAQWPQNKALNSEVISNFDYATEIVSAVRTIRKEKQIASKDQLKLFVKTNSATTRSTDPLISRLANLSELWYSEEAVDGAFSFRVGSNEFYVPLSDNIDLEQELQKLRSELDYTLGFLKSVEGKLSNESFVNNAPEQVVAVERKKQSDAKAKIAVLEDQIKSLS